MNYGRNIQKKAKVLKTEITFDFENPIEQGRKHIIKIFRNELDENDWDVSIDGKMIDKKKARPVDDYLFCEKDVNGDILIGEAMYSCHKLVTASEGAFFIGNAFSCPIFLNPPGIVIDPCKNL